MKKLFLLLSMLTFIFSCRTEGDNIGLDQQSSFENNSQSMMKTSGIDRSSWIAFGNEYLNAYIKLHNYQTQTLEASGKLQMFYDEIGNSNIVEEDVEDIYTNYGLDFDVVLTYKNEMDNTLYRFALENPQILEVDNQDQFQNELI